MKFNKLQAQLSATQRESKDLRGQLSAAQEELEKVKGFHEQAGTEIVELRDALAAAQARVNELVAIVKSQAEELLTTDRIIHEKLQARVGELERDMAAQPLTDVPVERETAELKRTNRRLECDLEETQEQLRVSEIAVIQNECFKKALLARITIEEENAMRERIAALTAKLTAAQADGERLDWLLSWHRQWGHRLQNREELDAIMSQGSSSITTEKMYIVRLYDGMDNEWMDITKPLSSAEAERVWNEKTANGTKNTHFNHIDYYKISEYREQPGL